MQTMKIKELSGQHTGMAISVGQQGESLGWSWTIGGVLIEVRHRLAEVDAHGRRRLQKSYLDIMLRTGEDEQSVEVYLDPNMECQVSSARDDGQLHHGLKAA